MGEHQVDYEAEPPLDLNNPPFHLTAIDREILATKDEDYHRITWSDLKEIIGGYQHPLQTQSYPYLSYHHSHTIPCLLIPKY